MPRAKRGTKARARRNRLLKLAKGNYAGRSKQYKTARYTVERGLAYAFRGRKEKKRQFRSLWIVRINAVLETLGVSYSRFIDGLKKAGIEINRKVLAEMALNDLEGFKQLVEKAKKAVA